MKTDFLTSVAYLVFSDLVMPTTALALTYGYQALVVAGGRASGHAGRIAGSVAEKMSQELKYKLGLNERSVEARRHENTAMVSDWINRGKNDTTIASGIRSLQRLDEPLDGRPVLGQHFNAQSIAGECAQDEKSIFQKALDFPATVIALLQSHDILTADREKMLAALALHLPTPGGLIPMELASLIDGLRGMNASIGPGLRLLTGNNPDKIAAFRQRPGVRALLRSDEPLHVIYRLERGLRPGDDDLAKLFIQWPGAKGGVMEAYPQLPESIEVAADELSAASPAPSCPSEPER